MWPSSQMSVLGNSFLRKFIVVFIALSVSFAGYLFSGSVAHAIEAGWDNDNVVVGSDRFSRDNAAYPNIPAGSLVYSNKNEGQKTARVVYFPAGTDINTATAGQYVVYTFNPPSTFTDPHDQQAIEVSPKNGAVDRSTGTTGRADGDKGETTNCAIEGIGWMVCPATRAIAWAMDKVFDMLKSFFNVQTITTDQNNPIYRMWEIMRGIANLSFVLAFLVIIYSQLTQQGLNNYYIKKMIPKLIIAAILVNLSFYICAIAVDLSNILGFSLQQMFVDMRGQIVGPNTAANTSATSWESVTTFILSGGTLAAAGISSAAIAVAGGASVLSLVVLLVPFLIGVAISAIVALLIIAARQAIIVILVTVAPIAFVAYLLPSTEKWFQKWRDLLMNMLVMFPMFAVVFGGAQLAGGLIIQSADTINMMLIGMFVQVAPLMITPLLIKFSSGFLSTFAGIVNNKNKGFVDSTRNRLGDWDQRRRHRRIAEGFNDIANNKRGPMGMTRRWAANREAARHEREKDDKAYQHLSEAHADEHWKQRLLNSDNESTNVFTPSGRRGRKLRSVRNAYASSYGAESALEALDAQEKREKEEAKTGQSIFFRDNGTAHGHSINDAVKKAALDSNLETQAAQSASRESNRAISAALEADQALRRRAAGIDTNFGESRALANAIDARVNDRSDGLKKIATVINVQNPSADDLHELATGVTNNRLGLQMNREVQEAAIKMVAGGGNVSAINRLGEVVDLSDTSDPFLRTAFIDELKTNSARPSHYSQSLLDRLGQGVPGGFERSGVEDAMVAALSANKFDAKGVLGNDVDTLRILNEVLRTNSAAQTPDIRQSLERAMREIIDYPEYRGAMGNRKGEIQNIMRNVGMTPPSDW